jgi:hypothetical protein
MKKLYLIDDESRFYPRIDFVCPSDVDLLDFTGTGMLEEFQDELDQIKQGATDCFFLIDLLMPIPSYLQRSCFWSEQAKDYEGIKRNEVCGLALVHYLIEEKKLYGENDWIEHIRLVTSYSSHMVEHLNKFKLYHKEIPKKLLIHKDDAKLEDKLVEFVNFCAS